MNELTYNAQNQSITLSGSSVNGYGSLGQLSVGIGTGYTICPKCFQSYSAYSLHQCSYKYVDKTLEAYAQQLMQPILTPAKETKMTKDTIILVNEQGAAFDSTDKGLDTAKELARTYSNKNKCRVFIFKPVWSCAPKTDLVESEL